MENYKMELERFERHLYEQEKSKNTIEKYVRDVRRFFEFLGSRPLERQRVIEYKAHLQERYRVSSVNSMVIALNGYLRFAGNGEFCVRGLRQQRQIFREEARELERAEYNRLLREARNQGKQRLCCILQTIAGTGMRIGELPYVTVEAVRERKIRINFKGKLRVIFLPKALAVVLLDYCRGAHIRQGSVFVTKSGKPVDRKNIWAEMKELCGAARVLPSKVFPHNLRHLFAKCFYEKEKDLLRLADYLGHSSVETTRRYTMMSSAEACERQMRLGLVWGEKKCEIDFGV